MAIRIYIDQGHNPSGFNTGAEGNGYYEQDVTYRIGGLLYGLFADNAAFEARLSRPTEDTVLGTSNASSLRVRVEQANAFGAELFLSLHTNASTNPAANGTECLIYSTASTVAYAVAGDILTQVTALTGTRNRGIIERPGLYVLRRTAMPAVLVEMGFLTNPGDAARMVEEPELFARGIYRGVLSYYGLL